MADARLHHHLFAHRQLPGTLFSAPERTMQLLRDDPDRFLVFLWDKIAERVPERERLAATGLTATYHPHIAGTADICIVTMPMPTGDTEAFFVALVGATDEDVPVEPRCFTLELSQRLDDDVPATVLGSWDAAGTHGDFGTGPTPDADAFLATVITRLASS